MIKRLLLLVMMVAVLTQATVALSVTANNVDFGSSTAPLERTNPLADDEDDRLPVTTSQSFVVKAASGESVTVTSISFSPESEYSGSNFNMSFDDTSFSLSSNGEKTIRATTQVPKDIDASADLDDDGEPQDEEAERVGTITVTYDEGNNTGLTTTVPVRMFAQLEFDVEVNVLINGDSYAPDDDEVEELRPDDNVEFCVNVENEFSEDDEVDMEVDIFIDGDSDFDPDNDDDDFDLDADDEEETCFDFDIDNDVEDGDDFDVDVEVVAVDDNGAEYRVEGTFKVEFESPEGEVEIEDLTLNPTTVCPGDSVTLDYSLENVGTEDQDFVRVQVLENTLGISRIISGISIENVEERDNEYTDSVVFTVPENAAEREYRVRFVVFFEDDDEDDTSSFQDLALTVRDCSAPSSNNNNDDDDDNNNGGGIVVQPPVTQQPSTPTTQQPSTPTSSTPVVVAKPTASSGNVLYIVGLVIVVLILLAAIGWLVSVLTRRR